MKKYTYKEVVKILQEYGYKLISKEYCGYNIKLILEDDNGYYFFASLSNVIVVGFNSLNKFDKSNPYTIQNIKLWLKLNNVLLELINTVYSGNKNKLEFKDKEGYFYSINLSKLFLNRKHDRFNKSNPFTIYNIKLWLKLNNIRLELLSNIYTGSNGKLDFKDVNGYYYSMDTASLQCNIKRGSPFDKIGINNPYTIRNIKLWCKLNNKPFELVSTVYKGSYNNLAWKCLDNDCNKIFKLSWSRVFSNRGCPECNKSNGEKKCKEILVLKKFIEIKQKDFYNLINEDNNIYFVPQKTFKGLIGIGGGLLSYDFYLPKYNLLIEYQGEYHDKVILNHKGELKQLAEARLIKQQEHDRRKKEYALSNGYNFLEIWYWNFENIKQIISDYLK